MWLVPSNHMVSSLRTPFTDRYAVLALRPHAVCCVFSLARRAQYGVWIWLRAWWFLACTLIYVVCTIKSHGIQSAHSVPTRRSSFLAAAARRLLCFQSGAPCSVRCLDRATRVVVSGLYFNLCGLYHQITWYPVCGHRLPTGTLFWRCGRTPSVVFSVWRAVLSTVFGYGYARGGFWPVL